MNDDIEAQKYNYNDNVYEEKLDGLIGLRPKIKSIEDFKSCNGADEIIQIQLLEKLVYDLVNSKVDENSPYYGSLIKLKDLIELENEKLILEFFDYCAKLCIEKEELELMCVVANLLQDFVDIPFYKRPISRFIKQLTYVKVPSTWYKINEFQSTNENHHGYKVYNGEVHLEPSIIDKFQKVSRHYITLCYLPLPGLFSYPEDSSVLNILFPHKISLFAKFIISYPYEVYQPDHASSGIIESPLFHAIIKFKWRSFVFYRFLSAFAFYIAFLALFTASIVTDYMSLRTIRTIMGIIVSLSTIRYFIIMYINGVGPKIFSALSTFVLLATAFFPTITIFMEIFEVNNGLLVIFRPLSILFLWLGIIGFSITFKGIGIIVIVIAHICRKVWWLFVFVVLVIFAASHTTVIYSSLLLDYDKTSLTDETKFRDFTHYFNSLNAFWSALLSDYGSWPGDDIFMSLAKVAYSLFITIIILNLMIALVNNVYSDVLNRVYTEWSMVRAQFIMIAELNLMTPSERQNKDYFPLTIFYEVFTEEVERWHKKLEEDDIPVLRSKIQSLNELVE